MSRPRFKTRRTEDPGQDPHWQDVMLPTSWQHLQLVPYKRDPLRQVSASHDKSSPRTTSLRPKRASPDSDWGVGHDTRREPGARTPPPRRVGDRFPRHANTPAGDPCEQPAPTRALMWVCSSAQPSHQHHHQLCHTQASPEALKHPLRRALA
jgi:hypothetical protein